MVFDEYGVETMTCQPKQRQGSKRDELIKAGIDEINQHGVTGFSIRRVADKCNVTCGAPAKHFGNRSGFIAAIIDYVNNQWYENQRRIIKEYAGDTRRQLVEISIAYIKFLVEHPHFRSMLMLKDDDFDNIYHRKRGELSAISQQTVDKYCASVNMDEETRRRKLSVIRSLIYGSALMFDNGEMEYNEDMLNIVRGNIDREFDLP